MNSLLFLTCGLALLSFLGDEKEGRRPAFILKEALFVFLGLVLFYMAAFCLHRFSALKILEIELLTAAVFFGFNLFIERKISVFTTVCGLGFWLIEHELSITRLGLGILSACTLYAAFRLALWAFQNKSLFYRAPAPLAGNPLLMVQAFWASVILTVLSLMFI